MPSRLTLFISAVVLFFSFVFFSYHVAKERFNQFDFDMTVKLQDHLSRRVDAPFSIFSLLGSAEVTGLLWLGLLALLILKRWWLTALSLFLFPLSVIIEVFGKILLFHPSPPYFLYRGAFDFGFPSNFVHTSYSYPSGHVTRTAFLITFVVLLLLYKSSLKKTFFFQGALVIFLGLMLLSRVYLGEHWTTDVIGGLLLGSSAALLAGVTIPQTKPKKLANI